MFCDWLGCKVTEKYNLIILSSSWKWQVGPDVALTPCVMQLKKDKSLDVIKDKNTVVIGK